MREEAAAARLPKEVGEHALFPNASLSWRCPFLSLPLATRQPVVCVVWAFACVVCVRECVHRGGGREGRGVRAAQHTLQVVLQVLLQAVLQVVMLQQKLQEEVRQRVHDMTHYQSMT